MKLGGGIEASNVRYGEDSLEVKVQAATPTDATPTDAILKDEDGYIISGKWECENGIVVKLADNVLTISGKGVLGTVVKDIINETICVSNKYKVECVINNGITEIPESLFLNCKGLSEIEISNSVTNIGRIVFRNCSNLISIEIPNSVTSIGACAFYACSGLSEIKVPNVTYIGGAAFKNCINLKNIEISSSLRDIEADTFSGCSNLSNIEIPNKITSIGDSAFYGCKSLSEIKIPDSVIDIREEAFCSCSNLKNIEISSSVRYIGRNVFRNCGNLRSIKVAENNKVYDSRENCNALIKTETNELIKGCNNTKILNSVKVINSGAFENCSGFIEIPNSVISIESGAFGDCGNVSSIKVAEDNKIYDSRENCNALIKTETNELIKGCNNTKIPNDVEIIGSSAFSGCSNLSNIEIPNKITSIGNRAFYGCNNLSSIEIPSSVISIGLYSFSYCGNLSSIKVAEDNKVYDSRENCNAIIETKTNKLIRGCENTKIFDSVTSIQRQAFEGCNNLSSIEIPSSVTRIEGDIFYHCSRLTKITNKSSKNLYLNSSIHNEENGQWYLENTDIIVTQIANGQTALYREIGEENIKNEDGLFVSGKWECKNGIIVKLKENVLTISGNGVLGEDIKDIITKTICKSDKYKVKCIINNGITEIPENLFLDCKGLSEIEISNSVTNIGYKAFSGCSNLSSIEIPSSVTKIGFGAFLGCDSLNNIKILEGLTIIEKSAFSGCSSLNSIEIPSSITNIGEDAFKNCNSLSSIKVAEGNKVYDSRDNCNAIIITETNELIKGCDNTKITDSVTSIGYSAFKGCNSLTAIEIPNSVVSIKANAFSDCISLKSIEIPETVTRIMYGVVSGCSNLRSIKVAENNKVYDSRENCNAIIMTETNILIAGCGNTKIPNSVTGIGDSAFYNCSSLTSIEIPSSVTKIELGKTNPFDGCKNLKRFTNNSSVDYFLNRSIHGYDDNGQWYLENTDTIIDKIANGQTAIYKKIGEDVKYGDINSDGEINIQDGVLLKKHLAGIKGLNIDMTASDVNVDGEVNIQDAVILIKHLAGMNVTMGKE